VSRSTFEKTDQVPQTGMYILDIGVKKKSLFDSGVEGEVMKLDRFRAVVLKDEHFRQTEPRFRPACMAKRKVLCLCFLHDCEIGKI
jgi:hypothetical protein